ncbi:MAG: nucleotidyltransferase family protein [Flavobacteriales bacterium]
MIELLSNKKEAIATLCEMHKVKTIAVFGSAARDTMTAQSDIDFLVQFSEDIEILDFADNYFSLLESLESLTGKTIDLVSVHSLRNPVLKEEIEKSKIELYAA